MTAVGGSIEEVSLSGRKFAVPADNEAQLNLGGFSNEVQPNGNGTGRLIKTRVANKVDGLLVEIDHSNGDLEFLQDLADNKDFFVFSCTLADGSVYQGLSQMVDEVNGSTQSATAAVSLNGPQKLTRQ
jgi:hypothetical protein